MTSEEEQQQQQQQTSAPQGPFHLDLHAWMEAQQTSHGVRHDDYAQYHAYCTRRLSRLSHHPDAKKYLVCSSKFATTKAATGGRHAFCSRQTDTFDLEDDGVIPHENVLWYLLLLAERSWAHANQLQKQKKKRQHVLRKLKKAQRWAQQLLKFVSTPNAVNAMTLQECQAYSSWMTANYALEKLDYQTASEEYAKAMSICQQLSETCPDGGKGDDDAKQLERQDLFLTRADTVLRPLFRYCQYELKQAGHELTVEEPRLATSTTSSVTKDDETSITFRGHDLLLDSKELRVLLLKLQSLKDDEVEDEKKETQKDETSFLTALSVIDDALEVVQTSLSILKQAQEGPAVQAKRQNLNLWKGYLKNEKTQRVMDHTTKLLVQNMGHAERVHVYESLLQMATSLLELPRPSSDEDDEEDEFALQVQANILRLRALKTYHMAWYYYQQARKYSKALTLVQHSQKLSKRAQEEIAACDEDMPHADQYLQELEDLPIASAQAAIQAALHLKQGGVSSSTNGHSTKRPLLLRLDDEDAGMVLADEDLMPMPIPCKPVFYDLAYDIATDASPYLDTLQSYVDKHTAPSELEPEEKTGGRLLGWLGGSK